jgi:serine/threonine-protein kinase RsbW
MADHLTQLKLPAVMESLRALTEFVHRGAQAAAFEEKDIDRLDLVIEEVVTNVIRYAYPDGQPGSIEVGYEVEGPGKMLVQVIDTGREFDPTALNPPDLRLGLADRSIGGLGIFLVKQIAHAIKYSRVDDQNVLSFRFEVQD